MASTKEHERLQEARERKVPWRKWGPYLSERQCGTVREDYSDAVVGAFGTCRWISEDRRGDRHDGTAKRAILLGLPNGFGIRTAGPKHS
jgi:hypothetical protein